MDKPRTFALMRQLGIDKAVLHFSGGNDEGGVEEIVVTRNGVDGDLPVVYGDTEYDFSTGRYVQRSEAEDPESELSVLLQAPVDEKYGSWAGDFSASGTLTWTLADEKAVMNVSESEYVDHSLEW